MPRARGEGPMGLLHEARTRQHEKYSGSMSPLSIANAAFLSAIAEPKAASLRARMERPAGIIAIELPRGEPPPARGTQSLARYCASLSATPPAPRERSYPPA